MSDWKPTSWQSCSVSQLPDYPDSDALARSVEALAGLPPLVTSWEVESLKEQIAAAGRGEAFLLQGGDCAESFDDCSVDSITAKLKILLQVSMVLVHGSRLPVVRVGRWAGQYAKPRSSDVEGRDGVELPSYRGDIVNRAPFTVGDRTPDPQLLLRGYEHAAMTLNFIRALADGGFADLHHPEYWDLEFFEHAELVDDYRRIVESIRESVEFMEAILGREPASLRRVDFYTSHEGLSLHYEQAQTRQVPRREGWYNLSTHFPWIGMRTAEVDGAHVEYFRGIRNPIGVKIGPCMSREWLLPLVERLNPENEPGRLTIIHRMGAGKVEDHLPTLLEAVVEAGHFVTWCCDPMHGNTETLGNGRKTRRFDKILAELRESFEAHRSAGTRLGGVHFELTGEAVTECIGGARGLAEADLERAYRSRVDPRLNGEQSLEMAMLLARQLRA
jgi:3-deoxy-7-phosphoheptulonate synthase